MLHQCLTNKKFVTEMKINVGGFLIFICTLDSSSKLGGSKKTFLRKPSKANGLIRGLPSWHWALLMRGQLNRVDFALSSGLGTNRGRDKKILKANTFHEIVSLDRKADADGLSKREWHADMH